MQGFLSKASIVLGASIFGLVAASADAAPWSRAYAVEWFEPAFYFGAKNTRAADAPGEDCPNGINPALDYPALFKAAGYTPVEIAAATDAETAGTNNKRLYAALRGPNKVNIYEHPDAWPDPGMLMVTGNIAEGFNLDGNDKTGFTSPTGEKGIDNNFYKVGGCTLRWRGIPRDAYYHKYANDNMRDGKHTIIVVVSGDVDPLNDPDARVAFYTAKDKLTKDANGAVAADYSFRLSADPRYESVVDARIVNGVIETKGPAEILMHDYTSDSRIGGQLKLMKARIKLTMGSDGTLHGLLGGYTPWETLWRENDDFIREITGHMNASALWYALQKNADGIPDSKTGKNTAISIAYRLDAVSAFAVEPDGAQLVRVARLYQPGPTELAAIDQERSLLAQRLKRQAELLRGASTTSSASPESMQQPAQRQGQSQ